MPLWYRNEWYNFVIEMWRIFVKCYDLIVSSDIFRKLDTWHVKNIMKGILKLLTKITDQICLLGKH